MRDYRVNTKAKGDLANHAAAHVSGVVTAKWTGRCPLCARFWNAGDGIVRRDDSWVHFLCDINRPTVASMSIQELREYGRTR